MDGKLISSVGIIFLAIFTRFPGPITSGAPSGSNGTPSRSGATVAPKLKEASENKELVPLREDGPWAAMCEYAASADRESSPPPAPAREVPLDQSVADSAATERGRWCLNGTDLDFQFLFATVPDPRDSHLALEFDRRMEAIVDAAEAAGYSYDRYWLPWTTQDPATTEGSQIHDRILHGIRAEQPGLLLFRGQNPKSVLLLFVIGETPTAGIRRTEFANAMRYMGEIDPSTYSDLKQRVLKKEVRIVGPSFSGSVPSLVSFVDQFKCPSAGCFHVIPASATNRESLLVLGRTPNIRLHEVLHDDNWSLTHFVAYMSGYLGLQSKDIALLTEDATDYANFAGRDGEKKFSNLADLLIVAFPREIAQLRNAYPDSSTTATTTKDPPVPQKGLTLTLKGNATSQDDVPPFAGAQLPLSQEAVLLNVASTLRREQIRAVGILATDIFDSLFLIRFLRSACPDIRIFVVQSDLLMARAAEDISLEGTLAVTTYPLIGRNQYWTKPLRRRDRNLLASAPTEAAYNATLILLEGLGSATLGADQSPPLDYSSPLNSDEPTPPLWLTAVGHNGYWPLTLLDEAEKGEAGEHSGSLLKVATAKDSAAQAEQGKSPCTERGEAFECEPPPMLWLLVLGLLCCWSLVYLLAVWFAERSTSDYFWLEDFALKQKQNGTGGPTDTTDDQGRAHTPDRAFYLLMEALILAAAIVVLSTPAWKLFDFEMSSFLPWYSGAFLLSWVTPFLAVALVMAAILLTAVFVRWPRDRFSHRMVWVCIGWALFTGVIVLWWELCYRLGRTPSFFAYRALDLASGVSPATPLIFVLAGFYVWARTHMMRLRFSEDRRAVLPKNGIEVAVCCGKIGLDDQFERAIRELYNRKLFLFNLIGFTLAFFLLHPIRYLRSLEGGWFDALYITFLAFLYFAISSNWNRFLLGWFFMRQLLHQLERQPWRFAFNRLSRELSWAPIWRQGGTRRTYLLFTRSDDYLQALSNERVRSDDAANNAFATACTTVHDQTQILLRNAGSDHWDSPQLVASLQQNLAKCAELLVADPLEEHWKNATTDLVQAPDTTKDPDPEIHMAEEYLALRCLAFIRYASLQLRNLLGFLTTAFILTVISLRTYPFQGPRSIGWSLTAIFVVLGAGIVIVFAQMDRDAILSRISQTQPGKLDREFFLRVVSFGALPLITVLASQFPSIGSFLFSWVQPGLEALR